jgi:uncharacterized membrane protein
LFAAIIFGIIYNLVTPPLQVPDEYDHFRRVFHISEGHFLPEKKINRLGGEIPASIKKFVVPYRFAATNLKYSLDKQTFFDSFNDKYSNAEKEFDDFPNTSYYTPVSYLPQSIAVSIIKQFNCSVATLYYFGRLFIFLFWVWCMYHLIKIVPICKWLFAFLFLLPMNIYMSNSYSADTVTNILSFTFIIFVLKYAFDEQKINGKRIIFLITIGVLLALSKIVYVGLILSFFIIPLSKFNNKKQFAFYSILLFVCSFGAAMFWSNVVTHYFTPYSEYDPNFRDFCCLSHCADYEGQKKYILSHHTYFLKVIYHSLFKHPYTYLAGYVGSFGNNDIPLPRKVLLFSYIVILGIAVTEKNSKQLSVLQKFILISASCFSFVLLLLSQHLTWDCVGEGIVDVVQGRYLIPLFPLVFLLFTNSFKKIKVNLCLLIIVAVCVTNFSAFKIIYKRYLTDTSIEKLDFTCDAEKVNAAGRFITSDSTITLDGVSSKNDSVAKNGKSSVLLSEKSPYSFIYKFKNLNYGDLIEVSASQKGTGAQMIFSGKGNKCGEFYYPYLDIKYKEKNGWTKMHYVFTMNLNCQLGDSVQVTFFMWNPGKTKTYIDDLKFSIKKFGYNYLDHKAELF